MTAIALLHPDVSPKVVERFSCSGVELKIQQTLDQPAGPASAISAALIFGGDGTVHRHLSQIYQQKIPVLVVPVGSGNDFARAFGIRNIETALRAWQQFCAKRQNVKEIDLGVIRAGGQEIFFCCVAGVGMDSDANARANRMPAKVKRAGGYLLAALQALAAFKPVEMTVTSAQGEMKRQAFLIAVGNAHSYGGGMRVTPRAKPEDGLLDICIVNKMNKFKLLAWMPAIFFGGHLRLKEVEYFQADHVRIETETRLKLYADGDYACQTPVEIGVLPKAIRVIVPV